jgi:purine nucleoside permease
MPTRLNKAAAAMLLMMAPLIAPADAADAATRPPAASLPAKNAPIEIRMVIVTAFEIGKDTGDMPGELQAWASEMPVTLPFPAGDRPLRYDPARKLLVLSTGVGTGRAAVTTMALGSDPRFDLSHAYWLVAAIAGVNPNTASIGSAAWIGNLVDTDLGYLIDAREIPADWPTGMVPLSRTTPYQTPLPDTKGNLFPLNTGLRDWAFALTRDMKLADSDGLRRVRARYTSYPAALTPPIILTGDEATGQGFWHGKILNEHTERWVQYWTGGKGRFVMTGMEDTGVIRAVDALTALGRADAKRVMVLRTASNYTLPPPGMTVADSLKAESQELTGLRASLDAAHLLGRRVADEITGRWGTYRDTVPGGPAR